MTSIGANAARGVGNVYDAADDGRRAFKMARIGERRAESAGPVVGRVVGRNATMAVGSSSSSMRSFHRNFIGGA